MNDIFINAYGIHCHLGYGRDAVRNNLFSLDWVPQFKKISLNSGRETVFYPVSETTKKFTVEDPLYTSRNNNVALGILKQIEPEIIQLKERYKSSRIGVVTATSTSAVDQFEKYISSGGDENPENKEYQFSTHESGNLSEFVADYYALTSAAYTVSTACTSGGKILAEAQRLIRSGLCDAVIVGACDTHCDLTLNGFDSLGATAAGRCRPFEKTRSGINIGEGGAFLILSKEASNLQLKGVGESSDAYHISSPDPEGHGARKAITNSLAQAGLNASQIDYVNLHGTGTLKNDAMESLLVHQVFGDKVPVSSTKSMVGHTLGASGAVEIVLSLMALEDSNGRLPAQNFEDEIDDGAQGLKFVEAGSSYEVQNVMSNSFAFGGSNVSVIVGRP